MTTASSHSLITPLEVRASHFDDRGGVGFVYFNDFPNYADQEVRMGWIGGPFSEENEDNPSNSSTIRYQPYVFTGNWGEPNFSHIIEAWSFMVRVDRLPKYNGSLGFADYAASNPDTIRWMNGSDFVGADHFTLTRAAVKERNDALRYRRQALRAARAR